MIAIAEQDATPPLARTQDNGVVYPAGKFIARAARLPSYDVISVYQNKRGTGDSSLNTTKNGILVENAPFREIVEFAYNLASFDLISGIPEPLNSARFNIRAKVADFDGDRLAKLTSDDFRAMTISVLADRFHLRVRVAPKKMTVYELIVAKDGPKIKLNEPDASSLTMSWGTQTTFTFKQSSMSTLAGVLSDSGLHGPVVNRTNLEGAGNFSLKWNPDWAEEQSGNNFVSIFTAIQDQLGLKLKPVKLPVDTLVIDHAEMPSAN
jgi:uncharacterized protein (TIGR03435 family)